MQPDGGWTYVYGVETDRDNDCLHVCLHVARVAGDVLRQAFDRPLFVASLRWNDDGGSEARLVGCCLIGVTNMAFGLHVDESDATPCR